MFQNACKAICYMEIIVFEIPSGGSKTISIPWPSLKFNKHTCDLGKC